MMKKKWLWYLLFPPYGLFVLLFKSKAKWYLKTIAVSILVMFLVLAIDQAVYPTRVEDHFSKELIQEAIKDEEVWHVDRLGAFPHKEKTFVLYRTTTNKNLYHVLVLTDPSNELQVDGIYQLGLEESWIKEPSESFDIPPIIYLALYESEIDYGEWVWNEEEGFIETEKDAFTYMIHGERDVSIYQEGELKENIQVTGLLPQKASKHFEKNQDELGVLEGVMDYTIDDGYESYYVQTNTGLYRVDRYPNGEIELLQGLMNGKKIEPNK